MEEQVLMVVTWCLIRIIDEVTTTIRQVDQNHLHILALPPHLIQRKQNQQLKQRKSIYKFSKLNKKNDYFHFFKQLILQFFPFKFIFDSILKKK